MGKNHKEKSVRSNPLTTDVEVASVIHKLRVFAEYRILMFSLNKYFFRKLLFSQKIFIIISECPKITMMQPRLPFSFCLFIIAFYVVCVHFYVMTFMRMLEHNLHAWILSFRGEFNM